MLNESSNIKLLGLDLLFVHLGLVNSLDKKYQFELYHGGEATATNEFQSALDVISSYCKLDGFRSFSLPYIEYSKPLELGSTEQPISDDDAASCQFIMHNFASQVVRYMNNRGSPMRVFTIKPPVVPPKALLLDHNGNRWPTYTYIKGVKADAFDGRTVAAIPMPVFRVRKEMCEQVKLFR